MGANVSSTVSSTINKTITDQSKKIFSSTDMYTTSNLSASQKQDLDLTFGTIKNCGIDISQNINIKNKIYSKIDSNKQLDILNKIQEALDNTAKQELENKISGLPIGTANVSNAQTYIENYNFHDLSTVVTNVLSNNVNSAISASQDQKIKLNVGNIDCASASLNNKIYIAQNIDIDNLIENTIKDEQVQKAVNDVAVDVTNSTETTVSNKIAGLDPFAWIGIAVAIIAVVVLVGLGLFFGFKKKLNITNWFKSLSKKKNK